MLDSSDARQVQEEGASQGDEQGHPGVLSPVIGLSVPRREHEGRPDRARREVGTDLARVAHWWLIADRTDVGDATPLARRSSTIRWQCCTPKKARCTRTSSTAMVCMKGEGETRTLHCQLVPLVLIHAHVNGCSFDRIWKCCVRRFPCAAGNASDVEGLVRVCRRPRY